MIGYSNLLFVDEIVVFQSIISESCDQRWVFLTSNERSGIVRSWLGSSKASRYVITDKEFEMKLEYNPKLDSGKGIQLYLKSKSFKSNDWYLVRNWVNNNADLLINSNKGIIENPENFEIAITCEGHCTFIQKETEQYDLIQLNSVDRDLFTLSKKTSKRKPGYSYITKDSKLIYLGEMWKFGYDKVTKEYKKSKIYAYTAKPLGDTVKTSLSIAIMDPDHFTSSEYSGHDDKVRCLTKNRYWVESSKVLENDLTEDFDLRALWKDQIEAYMKRNKKYLSSNSDIYYYSNLAEFYSIFLVSGKNTSLDEDLTMITPEIKILGEEIFRKNIYKTLCDVYCPSDVMDKEAKDIGYYVRKYRDLSSGLEKKDNLISFILNHAIVESVGYDSSLDSLYYDRYVNYRIIFEKFFGFDLESITEEILEKFKEDVEFLGLTPTWNDLLRWKEYIHSRYVGNKKCTITQYQRAPVTVTKSYSREEKIDLLDEHWLFSGRPNLKKTILEIFESATKNSGAGVNSFNLYSPPGKLEYHELSCEIELENIVNYYGGPDKVPVNLVSELTESGITKVIINTNNKNFRLK